ncbi:hypothetical protein J4210_04860 [Candidatus Woesearchaeota archaeon]|nr:hypothetical protein [Candidatus Woesearchaeota archaeon]
MQLTIQEKVENVLLDRTSVRGEVTFEKATPSNNELAEALSKQLKVEGSSVVVKHIYTQFGHQKASFEAVAYKTPEARQQIEKTTKHLRKKMEESKKGEA